MGISIKTTEQIEIMRKAGKKLALIMREIEKEVSLGKKTSDLDKLAEKLVFDNGGEPAFKGYGEKTNPFPATICASVNQEIVHGIPSEKKILKEGDVFKVDIGMKYQGFFVDMARTFIVGKGNEKAFKIKDSVEQSFWSGIRKLKDGSMLSDYSRECEKSIKKSGFSIVKSLVGHGIGRELHEEPQIPNYYDHAMEDYELKEGMTLALEPMINEGSYQTKMGNDGWAFETVDGKLSAHYENTVLITKEGVEVLTM